MVPSELNKMDLSSKRYKKVPPEGGWGFLVLLGLAIFMVMLYRRSIAIKLLTNVNQWLIDVHIGSIFIFSHNV